MAKRRQSAGEQTTPATPKRTTFLAGFDPTDLLCLFEDTQDDLNTPYRALYQQLRTEFLQQHGPATVSIAALLDRIDDCLVEDSFRQAGFVLGFQVCRQLMLGEIDIERLKGGAR